MIALVGSPDPLTSRLVSALHERGEPSIVCVVSDRTELNPSAGAPVTFRVEHVGTLLQHLRALGVGQVCFSGGIRRPSIDPGQIDKATVPLVPRIVAALGQGDDGALRAALSLFEEAGFGIVAAHDLVPALLPAPGILSVAQPTRQHEADAARAEQVHRIMAPADVGQGLIVRRGQVIAVEAAPGTDVMLRSAREHAEGALFYKAPKLGQDRRADLPVIGAGTVELARASRLSAIVIEAGGVMMLDHSATISAADAAGLVLWVREPSQ
ncbi:LpxI family protein [Rubellimicrobium arenae]|uniref:LpxI family protein n=1 Tax=Rubellimicrobium arenae TaxID=2817372 RepID=UPI001B30872E|nr:UDP-2,3-diacylglucosamine diphosphatase LpxI [Rubellimicrobium arenae]